MRTVGLRCRPWPGQHAVSPGSLPLTLLNTIKRCAHDNVIWLLLLNSCVTLLFAMHLLLALYLNVSFILLPDTKIITQVFFKNIAYCTCVSKEAYKEDTFKDICRHVSIKDTEMQFVAISPSVASHVMMTAIDKVNTKRADACRPATSAPRKQSLHTEEERGVEGGSDVEKHSEATLHSDIGPRCIIYTLQTIHTDSKGTPG